MSRRLGVHSAHLNTLEADPFRPSTWRSGIRFDLGASTQRD